jgi:Kelch motif protein
VFGPYNPKLFYANATHNRLVAGPWKSFGLKTGLELHLRKSPGVGASTNKGLRGKSRLSALALLVLAIVPGCVTRRGLPPSVGTSPSAAQHFRPTRSMSVPRAGHVAVMLADGRVLIVGGWRGAERASAELYDPATRTFAPTGSLREISRATNALRLTSGDVLVLGMGGEGARCRRPNDLASFYNEIYHPQTGTFVVTAEMRRPRAFSSMTLLQDGKVLVAGGAELRPGWCDQYTYTDSAELYDPVEGGLAETGPMTLARASHCAALLKDGTVLIAGGYDYFFAPLAAAEIYDPSSGKFQRIADMAHARAGCSAIRTPGGRVVVVGGVGDYNRPVIDVESYDPAQRRFDPLVPKGAEQLKAEVARAATGFHYVAALPDGRILLIAVIRIDREWKGLGGIYDPTSNVFTYLGESSTEARLGSSLTPLRDGTVLMAGGYDGSTPAAIAGLYSPGSQVPGSHGSELSLAELFVP